MQVTSVRLAHLKEDSFSIVSFCFIRLIILLQSSLVCVFKKGMFSYFNGLTHIWDWEVTKLVLPFFFYYCTRFALGIDLADLVFIIVRVMVQDKPRLG